MLEDMSLTESPALEDGEAVEVGGRVVAERGLAAHAPDGTRVAWIRWAHAPRSAIHGEITWIGVHPDWQRQGVARALSAQAKAVEPRLHHSSSVTPEGAAWRAVVGDI
jgi:ribosomal protein S18 acetylase RimI-like enzyme